MKPPRISTRHRWTLQSRETHRTERVCSRCGMLKVTRHDGPMPWTEFWFGGAMDDGARTPICSPVARQAA